MPLAAEAAGFSPTDLGMAEAGRSRRRDDKTIGFFSMFQAGTSSLQPQVQRVEVSDFGIPGR